MLLRGVFRLSKKKKKIRFSEYDEQLKNLKQKGLNVEKDDLVIEFLKSNGYYNLITKYKNDWYVDNKQYPPETSIYDLYLYHRLEDDLRNILFRFTITFEKRLKETMAFCISKEVGIYETDYLNPLKYKRRQYNNACEITSFLRETLKKPKYDPTKYYRENYDNVPPWILLNNISLGQTRAFLSIFPFEMSDYVACHLLPFNNNICIKYYWALVLKRDEAKKLLKLYRSNNYTLKTECIRDAKFECIKSAKAKYIELVKNMISIIHDFRNNLAHGHQLIHSKSKTKLRLHSLRVFIKKDVISNNEFYQGLGKNDLFAFMLSLLLLLDKYDAKYFISQLKDWISRNTKTSDVKKVFVKFITEGCDLPIDFVSRLSKVIIEKTDRVQEIKLHQAPANDFAIKLSESTDQVQRNNMSASSNINTSI